MIEILQEAGEALSQAENKLRRIMETAVLHQRYADVATLAPLAEALLNMIGTVVEGAAFRTVLGTPNRIVNTGQETNGQKHSATAPPRMATSSTSRSSEVGYPRFERQGDRLVKLAWSKKDGREYEHRAPADVIFRVAEVFESYRSIGTPFLMDALMPFKTRKGEDIPSYQTYLALAWFRSLGTVESRGKDGYAVAVPQLRKQAEETWNNLPDTLRR